MADITTVEKKETQIVPAEDTVFSTGIMLPSYEDATDTKVLCAVKSVFKGFTPAEADNLADPDSVANYITKSVVDINNARQSGDASLATVNGAIAARFWYLANRLDTTLASGVLGDGAAQKLSDMVEPHMAVSTLYAYRRVATKLTLQEAWLLGVRGLRPHHLRKLSQIADDSMRRGIIRTFIETVKETGDYAALETSRSRLIAACGAGAKTASVDVGVDNMEDHAELPSAIPSAYEKGVKAMATVSSMVKKIRDNDKFVDLRDAMGMLYVSKSDEDAEAKVADAKNNAKKVYDEIYEAISNLEELQRELKSIMTGLTAVD